MAGTAIGCLQFAYRDNSESPKYGDMIQVKEVYMMRRNKALTKLTVVQNKIALTALRFTYADGVVEELSGGKAVNNDNSYGPERSYDVDLSPGEILVGTTIEISDDIPRKIGFTILKM